MVSRSRIVTCEQKISAYASLRGVRAIPWCLHQCGGTKGRARMSFESHVFTRTKHTHEHPVKTITRQNISTTTNQSYNIYIRTRVKHEDRVLGPVRVFWDVEGFDGRG